MFIQYFNNRYVAKILVISGLPQVFKKFLQGFLNFFQVYESTHFWGYFLFKIKFKVKNYVQYYNNTKNIL